MLECRYCDYYEEKSARGGSCYGKCGFTGHLFLGAGLDEEEYPCRNVSYDDYLARLEREKSGAAGGAA